MSGLFLFGTLLDPELRALVAGGAIDGCDAYLPDHRVRRAAGADFPVLVPHAGSVARGLLIAPDAVAMVRLHFYEEGFGFGPETMQLIVEGVPREVILYRAPDAAASDEDWCLDAWRADRGELTRRAAAESMSYFGRIDGATLRGRVPTIFIRAASGLRAAQHDAPATLRADIHRDRIEVLARERPYADYFAVDEVTLRHPRFDGSASEPVKRAGFVMGDAVTVLPYDPARDLVMLVEQFRAAPFLRGDPRPWALEPIAGRIDPGETPEQAGRREALEEADLSISALHFIGGNYPSPGAVTEYLFCYVGVTDLSKEAEGLGGLEAEGEDIRAHVIPFERLMDLVASGEVETGPTVLSALWLERERAAGRFA